MTNFEIFTNIVINELTKMAKGAEIQLSVVGEIGTEFRRSE